MLFTLLTGLIAVALPLNMLLVVSLSSARGKARDAKRVSDVTQMRTALELYATEHDGKYPVSGGFVLGQGNAQALSMDGFTKSGGTTNTNVIMQQVSQDPDPSRQSKYMYWSTGKQYVITVDIESEKNGPYAKGKNLVQSDAPLPEASFDYDNDGLPDRVEAMFGSSPTQADTDGDSYDDATELQNGFNPSGPGKLKL